MVLALLFLGLAGIPPPALKAQIITIPDPLFKKLLLETGIDENKDNEISHEEAEKLTRFEAINEEIAHIEGIGFFPNLKTLVLAGTPLEWANLSRNGLVDSVTIRTSKNLQGIDLPYTGKMRYLNISENPKIQAPDISSLSNLRDLSFMGCSEIKHIDVSGNPLLEFFGASDSGLESFDFSKNPKIKELLITGLKLTQPLDLSGMKNLKLLSAGKLGLKDIDLSQNLALIDIWLADNEIEEIDLSKNKRLYQVRVQNNELKKLELKDHPKLYHVWMHDNEIEVFKTEGLPELDGLDCSRNKIKELDLSSNIYFVDLFCEGNPLIYLNVQNDKTQRTLEVKGLPLKRVCCDPSETGHIRSIYPNVELFSEPGTCPGSVATDSPVAEIGVKLSPNPTNGMLHILGLAPEEVASVSVMTLGGARVLHMERATSSINIATLPAATYIAEIKTAKGSSIKQKVVKQ